MIHGLKTTEILQFLLSFSISLHMIRQKKKTNTRTLTFKKKVFGIEKLIAYRWACPIYEAFHFIFNNSYHCFRINLSVFVRTRWVDFLSDILFNASILFTLHMSARYLFIVSEADFLTIFCNQKIEIYYWKKMHSLYTWR